MATPATQTPPARSAEAIEPNDAPTRIGKKFAKMYHRAETAEKERDAARQQVEALAKQVADLTKGAGDVEALRGELRTLKHRTVADQVLREAGINPAAIEAFYKLSEMKFDGDAPDPAKIKAFVEEQKGKLGYLFGEPPAAQGDGSPATTEAPPVKPGPGRGQGGHGRHDSGVTEVTDAQLRDPNWCMQNQALLQKVANQVGSMPVSRVADVFKIH